MTAQGRTGLVIVSAVVALVAAVGLYAVGNRQRPRGAGAAPVEGASGGFSAWSRDDVVVPKGTSVSVRLQTTLSTRESHVGDGFVAVVASPVVIHEQVAIPAGAQVKGHLAVARQPGKASGRGELELAFDDCVVAGGSYTLDSRSRVYLSASGTKQDVAMIGGGAVAGGILGGLLGHGAGSAVKGAVVGGAAGTGASLLTRGPQLTLPAGRTVTFRLDHDLPVRRSTGA